VIRRIQTRRGFTLVELLVVIGIIVTLLSLLMAGFSAVRTRQQEKATDDIVFKLETAIDNQRKEIVAQAAKERRERSAVFTALLGYCDNDEDRAQALHTYLKLRHAFPQTWAEAQMDVVIPGFPQVNLGRHKAYLSFQTYSGGTPHDQSAALLYAMASNMGTGGATFATDDATAGNQSSVTFTGGAATVFKDAKGTPIGFKRFYESAELNAAPYTNAKSGFLDPFDPLGKLATWNPTPATKKSSAEGLLGTTFRNSNNLNNNKTITAYSFGQDRQPNSADDVYGFRLFKLGNRGSLQ
jgi:prepilin-type N-terminal cleavage/methylation domain-containing protein